MPKLRKPTYKELEQQWRNCTRCRLCELRKKVVMAKGQLPADVMLIGEAPGASEDVIGSPFVGPAGKLIGQLVKEASEGLHLRFFWTNLVSCIPKDEDTKRKRGEPLPDEIEACRPRLDALIELAKPDLIVCVGQLSEKQAKLHKWEERAKLLSIVHPAYLLRLDVSQKGLAIQRCYVQLRDAFQDLIPF